MSRDPRIRKIAEENASFVQGLPSLFGKMAEMLPPEERKLFEAAAGELQPGLDEAAAELRSGKVDEALAKRKPPALWELEKHMYNKAAADVGMPGIEEYEDEDEE